ncbi:hypothetical protein MRB53_041650 [Persea americana]|nr:hypothetical protein MRB53_041650 [Persea americana]
MRDGRLHALEVTAAHDDGAFQINQIHTWQVGVYPVTIVVDGGLALVSCGQRALHMTIDAPRLFDLKLQSIWICDPDLPSLEQPYVKTFLSTRSMHSMGEDAGVCSSRSIACLTQSSLLLGELNSSPRLSARQWAVPGVATRVARTGERGRVAIGSNTVIADDSDMRIFPVLTISLIDPDAAATNVVDSDELGPRTETVMRQHPALLSTHVGRTGERLCALVQCTFTRDSTAYNCIVAALAITRTDPKTAGLLRFLRVVQDQNSKRATLTVIHESQEPAPVLAICQYLTDAVLYCTGKEIRMRAYSQDDKRSVEAAPRVVSKLTGARFHKRILYHLQSPGNSISVQGSYVIVGTLQHSTAVFRFDGKLLRLVLSDDVARDTLAHLALPKHQLLLTADKHQTLSMMTIGSKGYAAVQLPCSLTRIAEATARPPSRHEKHQTVIERNIIGTGSHGILYGFSIVTESSWRLLRFIQNMCLRERRICPSITTSDARLTHLEPCNIQPEALHIDGDILCRLLDCGDVCEVLDSMLDAEPATSPWHATIDYDTASARRARFEQLTSDAVGQHDGPVWDYAGNIAEGPRASLYRVISLTFGRGPALPEQSQPWLAVPPFRGSFPSVLLLPRAAMHNIKSTFAGSNRHLPWSDKSTPSTAFGMPRHQQEIPRVAQPSVKPAVAAVVAPQISPPKSNTLSLAFNVPFTSTLAGPDVDDIIHATPGAFARWTHQAGIEENASTHKLPVHVGNVENLRTLCRQMSESSDGRLQATVTLAEPRPIPGLQLSSRALVTNVCLSGEADIKREHVDIDPAMAGDPTTLAIRKGVVDHMNVVAQWTGTDIFLLKPRGLDCDAASFNGSLANGLDQRFRVAIYGDTESVDHAQDSHPHHDRPDRKHYLPLPLGAHDSAD